MHLCIIRVLTLVWYIDILLFFNSSNTKKNAPTVKLNLFFFLASLLQYTSIDKYALFMRSKKKKNFTPLLIKIIFLFSFLFSSCFTTTHLSLSLSLSLSRYFPLLSQTKAHLSLISQIRSCPCRCRPRPYLHKSHPCRRPCRRPWIHLAQSSTLLTHLPKPPTHLAQSLQQNAFSVTKKFVTKSPVFRH